MDYTQTLTLLRLNKVPEDAPPEVIRDFLTRANYNEADVTNFLNERTARLSGTPPAPLQPSSVPQNPAAPSAAAPSWPPAAPPSAFSTPSTAAAAPRKLRAVPLIALVILILVLGGAAYTAYAVYGVPANTALLNSAADSLKGTKFHIDLEVHTATSSSQTLSFSMPTDIDATDPKNPKIDAKVSFDISIVSGSLDLRIVDGKNYIQVGSAKVFGVNSPADANWYEVPASELKTATQSPIDPTLLVSSTTDGVPPQLRTWISSGALTESGKPTLGMQGGRPIVTYTFAIDPTKLPTHSAATDIQYGPIVVTKELFTGKLVSMNGSVTATSKDLLGNAQKIPFTFGLTYKEDPSISITAPKDAKPIDSMSGMQSAPTVTNSTSQASARKMDADVTKAYLDEIGASAAIYGDQYAGFGTTPSSGSCSAAAQSKTVFSDPQVKSMIMAFPAGQTCRANGTAYAISAQLGSGASQWYCVDSKGAKKTVTDDPLAAPGTYSC